MWMKEDYEVLGAAVKKAADYTNEQISAVRTKISVYPSYADLPSVGDPNVWYLVPHQGSAITYDIYAYEDSQYVYKGTTQLNLDGYTTDAELNNRLTPIESITGNFVVENGKLCVIISDDDSQNESSNEPVATDATLQALVDAVEDIADNISQVAEASAAEAATAWMSENVTPVGSAVVVDNSLIVQGAAADAKKTGDEISGLKSALKYEYTTPTLTFESGAITNSGDKNENNARIRIGDTHLKQLRYGDYVTISGDYEGKLVYYSAPYLYAMYKQGATNDWSDTIRVPQDQSGTFVSVLIRCKSDPTADISADVSSMNTYVSMYIHTSAIDGVDNLEEINEYYGTKYFMEFLSGSILPTGDIDTSKNTRIVGISHKQIKKGDVFDCDARYLYKYAIYDADTYTSEHFVVAPLAGQPYAKGKLVIDPIYEGNYIAFMYEKVGSIDSTITTELGVISNYTGYYNFKVLFDDNPLNGKKLSLLGGSISAYNGKIPSENRPYYYGDNAGVSDWKQMWWHQLCLHTGMEELIIDAWSGSGITQLEGDHANRVPMSDDSRCKDIDDNGTNPDVILLIGGTNDWTYASSNANLPLAWDGKTTPVLTNSFSEALAVTIKKIQDTYPNAILVVCSTVFCIRPTWDGYASVHTVNGVDYTLEDYDNAIENVCKIMRVPYLKVNDIGFNPNNYYPTYCIDSSTSPTHPNAAGHAKIGRFMADRLTELIGNWFK